VYLGGLTLDLLLGDVRSLKQKRSVVASVVAEGPPPLSRRRRGRERHTDLHRRAEIGVAVVSSHGRSRRWEVLDACERLVAARPDIELLSARQRLLTEEE